MTEKKSGLDAFVEEVADLKKARELLSAVFTEIGPYRDGKVSDKTWNAVSDYFKFDDYE
jgi:hypothetical protein